MSDSPASAVRRKQKDTKTQLVGGLEHFFISPYLGEVIPTD